MLHETEMSCPLPHFAYGELWQRNQSRVPVQSRAGLLSVSFLLCCCLLHIYFQVEYDECYDNAFLGRLSWVLSTPDHVHIPDNLHFSTKEFWSHGYQNKSKHIAPAALCLFSASLQQTSPFCLKYFALYKPTLFLKSTIYHLPVDWCLATFVVLMFLLGQVVWLRTVITWIISLYIFM